MFPGPGPRPRNPFQGGMPPNQMMHPMQGRPPNPMGMMQRQPMRGPQSGGLGAAARGGNERGGGGLLSRILGGGSQARGAASAASAAGSRAVGSTGAGGSGILQTLTNPGAINGFLSNTQKFLNTAGQFGPMVQQYGPMVKNIPSMWKLYRGLKNLPDADTNEEKAVETETKAKKNTKTKRKPESISTAIKNENTIEPPQEVKRETSGQSMPKLYI